MPEYLALRCAECGRYQVQQRRKDGRFRCPVCGTRQSVQAVAGVAHQAKPLRELVQRLNTAEGERREAQAEAVSAPRQEAGDIFGRGGVQKRPAPDWSAYLTQEPEEEDEPEVRHQAVEAPGFGKHYVTALPAGRLGDRPPKRPRVGPVPRASAPPGRAPAPRPSPVPRPAPAPRSFRAAPQASVALREEERAPPAASKWGAYLEAEGGGSAGEGGGALCPGPPAGSAWASETRTGQAEGLFVTELP